VFTSDKSPLAKNSNAYHRRRERENPDTGENPDLMNRQQNTYETPVAGHGGFLVTVCFLIVL